MAAVSVAHGRSLLATEAERGGDLVVDTEEVRWHFPGMIWVLHDIVVVGNLEIGPQIP